MTGREEGPRLLWRGLIALLAVVVLVVVTFAAAGELY